MVWQGMSATLEHGGDADAAAMLSRSDQVVHQGRVCYNAPRWRDERRAAVLRRILLFGCSPVS
jgi:hypothetical protein